MTEAQILDKFLASPRNAKCRTEAVNSLRHLVMDNIVFDVSNDVEYMHVYEAVMRQIATSYPLLSWEVKRQMAKKKRRQSRRSLAVEVGSNI